MSTSGTETRQQAKNFGAGEGAGRLTTRRGTTLVLSVLVLWLILAIASSLATLLIGGLRISGDVTASVVAIYAADAGVECFLRQERIESARVCDDAKLDDDGNPATPCPTCDLRNGASYQRLSREKVGSTVTIKVAGSWRDANRGLQVTYNE